VSIRLVAPNHQWQKSGKWRWVWLNRAHYEVIWDHSRGGRDAQ
jgi:hypothetical protein